MVVELSFESLREEKVRAMKEVVRAEASSHKLVLAPRCPKFPIERFDEIVHIRKSSAMRRKAIEDGESSSHKGGATTVTDVISSL
jgi:hypothetical protein